MTSSVLGIKCNMTIDIMAAMGLIQFERYPTMLKRRRAIIEKMDVAFADLNVTYSRALW